MEIGGTDVIIPHRRLPKETVEEAALEVIRGYWPNLTVERAERPLDYQIDVFVYENEAAERSWNAEGGTDANAGNMIYLILGADELTLVHDYNDEIAEAVSTKVKGL